LICLIHFYKRSITWPDHGMIVHRNNIAM